MIESRIYLLNNDFVSGAIGSEDEWLRRGIAVTSGLKRGTLQKPEIGHLIALHVNCIGIVAVGVVSGHDVREVRDQCVHKLADWEFHRDVIWLYDLRQQPISTATLTEWKVSRTQTGAYMHGDRSAKLLTALASLQPVASADQTSYELAADVIASAGDMGRPAGIAAPTKVPGASGGYVRDPAVRAWTLKRSNFHCECCGQPAPFKKTNGSAYLESHHLTWLTKGGEDTPQNTTAVCANCHRELHYGERREPLTEELRTKILAREQALGEVAKL